MKRSFLRPALLSLAVAAAALGSVASPAHADDRDHWRRERHYEQRRDWHRDYRPYAHTVPGYYAAPPPVVYAPPPPRPGINLVFPLNFR